VVLAREAVHIKERIHGINHPSTGSSLTTLCDILQLTENSEEVKGLLERCLAIEIERFIEAEVNFIEAEVKIKELTEITPLNQNM
jgi:hypothetical protein